MSKWIKIEDDTPQDDFDVLVCNEDDVTISTYRVGDDGYGWFDIEEESIGWNITHWMPLPEAPKVEE